MDEFRVTVPQQDLADLDERLERTRIPPHAFGTDWSAGTDQDYLRDLIEYWRHGFDWRAREAWLGSFPQFTAEINGQRIHFAHIRAPRSTHAAAVIPIILSHGWPYSFAEMLPLGEILADPAARGGDPADAFDVVIPSLPGYGFSASLKEQPFTSPVVAELWHTLMTEELGYERYATYGEDVGARVSDRTAALHPDQVIGLFATHAAFPPESRKENLSTQETAFIDWLAAKWTGEDAYARIQSTKPDTLAVGLNDSPAGLAAWLIEKFRTWSDGEFETAWTRDELLTTVMLYWVTQSVGTTFRPYFDGPLEPEMPLIDVPVGVAVQWGERGFPRSYAERTYTDLRTWTNLPRGGHFTAKQTPELVATRMREFFRPLR